MVRFLHTADWQLGMRRHFLDEDAQARFSAARVEAIVTMGDICRAEGCGFVVVAGDVFESNHIDRRTVCRALDALSHIPVPVYLLPGNHDPLDAASVYTAAAFTEGCPAHVHVLRDATPIPVAPGVEVVGMPWPSKRPAHDLVSAALETMAPAAGVVRVGVGHGAVSDGIFGTSSTAISLAMVEAALGDGRLAFLALGDRHSTTAVGSTGRVWYSGAPEPTDFDETDPGNVLLVDVTEDECHVERRAVGTWSFRREVVELAAAADVDDLAVHLARIPHRNRTILRLGLRGTIGLAAHAQLTALLDDERDVFAAIDEWDAETDLVVIPNDSDLATLDVAGFARTALDRLVAQCASAGDGAETARDAVALLHRMVA